MLSLCFASLALFAVLIISMLDVRKSSFFGYFVPWERRRSVPWSGLDVLMIFVFYILLMSVSVKIAGSFVPPGPQADENGVEKFESTVDHPLTQLIQQGKNSSLVLLLVFFSGVISAPIAEEFLFRVIIQGWLEKLEHSFTRPLVRFHGAFSITAASVFFAVLHGGNRSEQQADFLFYSFVGIAASTTLFPILAAAFLMIGRGATLRDFGLRFDKIFVDLRTAAFLFLLVIPPLFFLQASLQILQPGAVTDPIPLFFFAVVLGFVYYRTKRFATCAALHAMLNGASFIAVLFAG